jgi:competence protein ComEC
MKSSSWFRICTSLVLLLSADTSVSAAGKLRVQMFDVGQGDAILVTCPDGAHQLLIDSGCNKYPKSQENFRRALETAIKKDPNKKIELAVASHPHSDHIGGMAWVLSTFNVGTYIDNGRRHDTATYGDLQKLRKRLSAERGLRYIDGTEDSGQEVDFCTKVRVRLVTPAANDEDLDHPNDLSVGIRLDYKDGDAKGKSFLFIGDMEEHAEDSWHSQSAAFREFANVDVLKVGHHGSDTSSSARFVQLVSPEVVLVSCGARDVGTNKRYMHPRASTLNTYADWFRENPPPPSASAPARNIQAYNKPKKTWNNIMRPAGMWFTVADGSITVETDGTSFTITTTNPNSN